MITLMGFPPTTNNVYENEDFNEINPKCNHKAALIGFCGKGPVLEPIKVHTIGELYNNFGLPIGNDCNLINVAEQLSLVSNDITVIRISDESLSSKALTKVYDETGRVSLIISSESSGTCGLSTNVEVINNNDNFSIKVYNNNLLVESWSNLNKDKTSQWYVESIINTFSNWIFTINVKDNALLPASNSYYLKSDIANNGIPSNDEQRNALFIKAIDSLKDYDLDLDFIALPACSSPDVIKHLINFCEEMGDCLAIIDPPAELSYSETIIWQNTLPKSDYGALFWPWVWVKNSCNQTNLVPPCGSALSVLVKGDKVSAPWKPATGLNNGIIPGITDIQEHLDEEDYKMAGEKGVNPIIYLPEVETFINRNQLTLNENKISEKRTSFLIKKLVTRNINTLLSDCDVRSEYFRATCTKICNKILNRIKNGQGINDYSINTGDDLNKPEFIELNKFNLGLGIQPIGTDKVINFNFEFSQAEN